MGVPACLNSSKIVTIDSWGQVNKKIAHILTGILLLCLIQFAIRSDENLLRKTTIFKYNIAKIAF
jgi:hypothetical protein